jgi:hypothetical protein
VVAGAWQYRQVRIDDGAFSFDDTKFALTDAGKARINIVADPATGSTYFRCCRCNARRLIVRRCGPC